MQVCHHVMHCASFVLLFSFKLIQTPPYSMTSFEHLMDS